MTDDLPPPFALGLPGTALRTQLVHAVLRGEKIATAGLADDEPLPSPGDRFTLHDFDDEPVGVVEVTDARVVPANEIDLQFARDEGEGFESVGDWRRAHEEFFGRPLDGTPISAVRFRLTDLVIAARYRGPARSGNGGYTCGLVAGLLGGSDVEVTLRAPPPLDRPLRIVGPRVYK
ncbi:MAG TPA: ASCH domain-containing protein, partial [Gaiellaceae bacterium]